MDTNEPIIPSPTPAPIATDSARTSLIVGVLITVVVIGIGGFALRQELLGQIAFHASQEQQAVSKLSTRVTMLESQTATLAALPRPDPATIDAMHSDLGTAQATITQLNERIATLEKKTPAPQPGTAAAPATDSPLIAYIKTGAPYQSDLAAWDKAHPNAGDHIRNLRATAAAGVATDEQLRTQLVALLGKTTAPAPVAEDGSMLSRINTHLNGLISIKKKVPGGSDLAVIQALAPSAPIALLVQKIEALPAETKLQFAPWLEAVHARDAALAELPQLDSAP